jgi:hypothetical protein
MTRDEIQAAIVKTLNSSGIAADEIRIQPDSFGGWRIVVISPGFEDMIGGDVESITIEAPGLKR